MQVYEGASGSGSSSSTSPTRPGATRTRQPHRSPPPTSSPLPSSSSQPVVTHRRPLIPPLAPRPTNGRPTTILPPPTSQSSRPPPTMWGQNGHSMPTPPPTSTGWGLQALGEAAETVATGSGAGQGEGRRRMALSSLMSDTPNGSTSPTGPPPAHLPHLFPSSSSSSISRPLRLYSAPIRPPMPVGSTFDTNVARWPNIDPASVPTPTSAKPAPNHPAASRVTKRRDRNEPHPCANIVLEREVGQDEWGLRADKAIYVPDYWSLNMAAKGLASGSSSTGQGALSTYVSASAARMRVGPNGLMPAPVSSVGAQSGTAGSASSSRSAERRWSGSGSKGEGSSHAPSAWSQVRHRGVDRQPRSSPQSASGKRSRESRAQDGQGKTVHPPAAPSTLPALPPTLARRQSFAPSGGASTPRLEITPADMRKTASDPGAVAIDESEEVDERGRKRKRSPTPLLLARTRASRDLGPSPPVLSSATPTPSLTSPERARQASARSSSTSTTVPPRPQSPPFPSTATIPPIPILPPLRLPNDPSPLPSAAATETPSRRTSSRSPGSPAYSGSGSASYDSSFSLSSLSSAASQLLSSPRDASQSRSLRPVPLVYGQDSQASSSTPLGESSQSQPNRDAASAGQGYDEGEERKRRRMQRGEGTPRSGSAGRDEERRRAQNQRSQKRCRDKRKRDWAEVQEQQASLREENARLAGDLASVRERLARYEPVEEK